jgi:transcriptional regulator with XRE-family HTH domain
MQIKKYRKQKNFSQEELAEKVYVSRQTIYNWENDRSYPTLESLLILSALFDISLDTLVKGDIDIMKRELSKHDMNLWTRVMLLFLFLGIVVGIPAAYIFSYGGLMVAATLLIISIVAALKVDNIKKDNDLKTYQEILDFDEGRELSSGFKEKNRQGYWKMELLLIFGSIIVTLILSGIVLLIMRIFY